MFLGRQPRQDVKFSDGSGTDSVLIFKVLLGGLIEPKLQQFISQNRYWGGGFLRNMVVSK
jgi:hypothetical protein